MFVTADDPAARAVVLEPGLPIQDMQPGGLISGPDVRAYATREARVRLHQQRFKLDVMRAYRHRCAICALRERTLVQAAHIVPDVEPEGIAAVVNGLALCAIHHLAFDRNVLGIDPGGVVHIARRLLDETDGPMLRAGLQASTERRSRFRAGRRTGPTRRVWRRDTSGSSGLRREATPISLGCGGWSIPTRAADRRACLRARPRFRSCRRCSLRPRRARSAASRPRCAWTARTDARGVRVELRQRHDSAEGVADGADHRGSRREMRGVVRCSPGGDGLLIFHRDDAGAE